MKFRPGQVVYEVIGHAEKARRYGSFVEEFDNGGISFARVRFDDGVNIPVPMDQLNDGEDSAPETSRSQPTRPN